MAVLLTAGTGSSPRPGRALALDARELLVRAGFSTREIAQIDRGTPVSRVLDTDHREVAVAGAVKIRAPRELLIERVRTIDYLKGAGNILDVHGFGAAPSAGDMAALNLEPYDLDLRTCQPGDCRVRLSADDIARFHREVNWRSPDWLSQSAAVWRQMLSGYTSAYLTRGPAALPVYANKEESLAVEGERQLLIDRAAGLSGYAPELFAYLRDPSGQRARGIESLTYWSVEDFGIRSVVRVIHQALLRPAIAGAPVAIATDQIYAAHYLDAALGLAFAHDVPGDEGRAFYLVITTRARTRSLSGLLRAPVRSAVRERSRDAVARMLTSTKRALESPAGAGNLERVRSDARPSEVR